MHRLLISLLLAFTAAIIGFLAQRSRMCFIGGFRDFILVRDKELLTGLITLLVSLWFLTSLFYSQGWLNSSMSEYGNTTAPVKKIQTMGNESIEISAENNDSQPSAFNIISVYPYLSVGKFFWVSLIGGFLMGFMSVQAGGCVLRQHVMAAQGNGDALYFILGLYSAVLVYDFYLRPFMNIFY